MRDFYADLGVEPTATLDDIHAAWRARLRENIHPDQGGDREAFLHTRAAYEALKDPKLRAQYDATRRGQLDPQIFKDLFVTFIQDLGPEFVALRLAAQTRNWLGIAVGGAKVGAAAWLMSQAAKQLAKTTRQPPLRPKAKREEPNLKRKALPKGKP